MHRIRLFVSSHPGPLEVLPEETEIDELSNRSSPRLGEDDSDDSGLGITAAAGRDRKIDELLASRTMPLLIEEIDDDRDNSIDLSFPSEEDLTESGSSTSSPVSNTDQPDKESKPLWVSTSKSCDQRLMSRNNDTSNHQVRIVK
jgi:hypothetical protein